MGLGALLAAVALCELGRCALKVPYREQCDGCPHPRVILTMRRPRFIAGHARNARGLFGRAIAFIMARETWSQNLRAMDALGIDPSDRILDLGCGHGRGLTELAGRASTVHVVGADSSELMVEIAAQRNRALIKADRVKIVLASVERLPFPDDFFDKVLCVHVLYFWKDLDASMREIARVLKPGGRLGLLFRTSADAASVKSFPPEIYRIPAFAEVVAAVEHAGLNVQPASDCGKEPALLLAEKRALDGIRSAARD